jgi:hypothetical protein
MYLLIDWCLVPLSAVFHMYLLIDWCLTSTFAIFKFLHNFMAYYDNFNVKFYVLEKKLSGN